MPIAQFSGLATGIDSAALIDAVIESRSITNEIRRREIEGLESENDALEEFNTKILALNDLIDQFRSISGGGISKKASSSNSQVATAAPGSGAINSTFTVDTTSVADVATASFDDSYASNTALMVPTAGAGPHAISVDIGTGADLVNITVNITDATTIDEYVTNFNSDSNAAGRVAASLVNIGTEASADYRVMFTTLESGVDKGTIAFSIPVIPELQSQTIDQATNAEFTLSGITGTITRDSNTVEDVLQGVTLNLVTTGTANITITDDPDSTADAFQEIVDAYNDLYEFVEENDTVTRVESNDNVANIFGSLAQTSLDNDFLSAFRTQFAAATSANGTSATSFSQMGVSTNRDGTLDFDIEQFKQAIAEDNTGVQEVLTDFADNVGGVDGFLFQYTKFQGFIDIAQDSNDSQIENLNEKIAQLDRANSTLRSSMELRFAKLESLTAELQSSQNALTAVLSGLG